MLYYVKKKYFFIISYKKSNIFFNLFLQKENKTIKILFKMTCGLQNRKKKNQFIQKRGDLKSKVLNLIPKLQKVFYIVFKILKLEKSKNFKKHIKHFIFLKFYFYKFDYKMAFFFKSLTRLLNKKALKFFKIRKIKIKFYLKINYNGCRPKKARRIRQRTKKK